jgi:hypothetical protein
VEVPGSVKERLGLALEKSVRSDPAELKRMLSYKLNVPLFSVVANGTVRNMVSDLIEWAESEGRLEELVRGAHLHNPGNPLLRQFHDEFFSLVEPRQLEALVVADNPMVDVAWWREQQEAHELRVCRVELGSQVGTGFLVASDLVLTNHHVVAPLLEGAVSPRDVRLRFDFKRGRDGFSVPEGRVYPLASNWRVGESPPDPVDSEAEPKSGLPDPDHLDYALLRTDGAPGKEVVGERPRGFVAIPRSPVSLKSGTPLVILQHPKGEPMKMALDPQALLKVNGNETRVYYRTNTMKGSSGSPCFNLRWELLALHHGTDPQTRATYNEGIPISTLRAHLEKTGLLPLLGT